MELGSDVQSDDLEKVQVIALLLSYEVHEFAGSSDGLNAALTGSSAPVQVAAEGSGLICIHPE